eukprot:6200073-Pleurochrysis_carterae.AAC.3
MHSRTLLSDWHCGKASKAKPLNLYSHPHILMSHCPWPAIGHRHHASAASYSKYARADATLYAIYGMRTAVLHSFVQDISDWTLQ